MKKIYLTGCLLGFFLSANSVSAQTHYGPLVGTNGSYHTFYGEHAGQNNIGGYNTFIGANAGKGNTSGKANTFVGSTSGHFNVSGEENTFVGMSAGFMNTTGDDNVYIGSSAGEESTTASSNTSVGSSAGYENQVGVGNTNLGYRAGYKNETEYNTFIGYSAGASTQSGYHNSFLGTDAGLFNKYGSWNSFYGSGSGKSSQGHYNSFFGVNTGFKNETGEGNSFFGSHAGYNNKTGQENTFIGSKSGSGIFGDLYNATAIGANAFVSNSNSLVLGNNANVGIGVSAPNYKLQLNTFSAAKPGSSTWIVASDRRLKKDVSDFKDGLDLIQKMKPVWFTYNGKAGIETDKKFVGIIAQEMQQIAPYTIGNFTYQDSLGNKTEYLDYDAGAVTYMLVNAVKEQQKIIEEKETKIQDLAKRLEQLERIAASGTIKPLTGNSVARQETEPNANGVMLEQNAPNGFSQSTAIRFFIPDSVKEAIINVYSVEGVKVGSYPVATRGEGSLTLSAEQFTSGVYVYDLITDGKSNGAKKMMVTK